ncbi:hypothetical protein B0T18DRAFT_166232 [Schizothecium vesticola]|uniref:Uncharacterized protein n=1 Tax=Schizothecium vesticola TaxID=314040 RepID=A0AA40K5Y1_9PEZI|nr:hypothetical protein B0T18DRAFT_166232 [Schizothecium vesticola]
MNTDLEMGTRGVNRANIAQEAPTFSVLDAEAASSTQLSDQQIPPSDAETANPDSPSDPQVAGNDAEGVGLNLLRAFQGIKSVTTPWTLPGGPLICSWRGFLWRMGFIGIRATQDENVEGRLKIGIYISTTSCGLAPDCFDITMSPMTSSMISWRVGYKEICIYIARPKFLLAGINASGLVLLTLSKQMLSETINSFRRQKARPSSQLPTNTWTFSPKKFLSWKICASNHQMGATEPKLCHVNSSRRSQPPDLVNHSSLHFPFKEPSCYQAYFSSRLENQDPGYSWPFLSK